MGTLSIRSLAARLNLSTATVSESLRGNPRVKKETRLRVIEEAGRLGYRINPAVSELMGRMRRSESNVFRGLIMGILPTAGVAQSLGQIRRRALMQQAAGERARELGFTLDFLEPGLEPESWARLPKVLKARGAVGQLIFPCEASPPLNLTRVEGVEYATVMMDATEYGAADVDVVSPDYHHAAVMMFRGFARSGFRRPGLVINNSLSTGSNLRWFGACAALGYLLHGEREAPPTLRIEGRCVHQAHVSRWALEHDVDVVITPLEISSDFNSPVCSLDLLPGAGTPMGLDLRWGEIAARSIDLIARKHFDRLYGRVEPPCCVSLAPVWRATDMIDQERGQLDAGSFQPSRIFRTGRLEGSVKPT